MAARAPESRRRTSAAGLATALLLLGLPSVGSALASLAPAPAPPGPAVAPGGLAPHLAAIPLHPPRSLAPLGRTASVNPTAYSSAEPAPMGITDFGVDGAGNGYTYQSSAFFGETYIQKLTVDNAGIGSTALTIQLNIVLSFDVGAANYQYWVQDVAFLDTGNRNLQFENNIWNFSGSGAGLDSNSVSGNGTIYSGSVYIAGASSTLPGEDITVAYPTQIGLIASVRTVNTRPQVVFQYRDTGKWVTYDNAIFPFAKSATNINYSVDGTGYNPIGLFDDAELILGGPGGGSTTAASAAKLSMSLSFFNGHNYQAVPNAFNFGSDTAETISNLVPSLGTYASNGSLWDNLSYGSGNLLPLYNASGTASVEIVTVAAGGVVSINGTTPIPFTTYPVNVTLAPGSYNFTMSSGGTPLGAQSVAVGPGDFLVLYLDAGTVSSVTFQEAGLPAGHAWTVTFGASTQSSRAASIRFLSIVGDFEWHLTPIPGFIANVTSGTLSVSGVDHLVDVNFTQVVYGVQLIELGLPNGTAWSVQANNVTFASATVSVQFTLPNGTFPFTLGLVPGWSGSPSNTGSLVIVGRNVTQTVHFRAFTYAAVFNESGLPIGGLPWGVEVGGAFDNTTIPQAIVAVPNGTYSYRVSAPAGWTASPSSGTLKIAAAPAYIPVEFAPILYRVTFTATGLDTGASWGVQVGRIDLNGSAASESFQLANGSYTYQIDTVVGYGLLTPVNSSFGVAGGPIDIPVVFQHVAAVTATLRGDFVPTTALLVVDGSAVATPGGRFDLQLLPGNHSLELTASGYTPYFYNFTLEPGASVYLTTIHLLKAAGPGGTTPTPTRSVPAFAGGIPIVDWIVLVGIAIVVIAAVVAVRRRG